MARYKLKNSNNTVNCEILNESAGDYIVRFKNGVIQNVPKNRVSQLDNIDEGVLDTVRQAAGEINKYGRKFVSRVKDIAKNIKNFIVNAFFDNGYIFFKDQDGEILPAVSPVNSMIFAQSGKCELNFYPGSDLRNTCDVLGIDSEATQNYRFRGEYEGFLGFDENVNESVNVNNSVFSQIFEAESNDPINTAAPWLADKNKVKLYYESALGKIESVNADWITNAIVKEYEKRLKSTIDDEYKCDPLLIFGAPGIGKSEILNKINNKINEKFGKDSTVMSLCCGGIGPHDLTMPAKIEDNGNKENYSINDLEARTTGNTAEMKAKKRGFRKLRTVISDLPKTWLPVYQDNDDAEYLNVIANNGKVEPVSDDSKDIQIVDEGSGGIFFMDEFTRLKQTGMDALMNTPISRVLGNSGLKFGTKWVIVAAGNRATDMSQTGRKDLMSWESASDTRFIHVNFVPKPEDWLNWAKSTRKGNFGGIDDTGYKSGQKGKPIPNVIEPITSYVAFSLSTVGKNANITSGEGSFGDYYEVWNHTKPEGMKADTQDLLSPSGDLGKACPRSWEALSELLCRLYLDDGIDLTQLTFENLVSECTKVIGRNPATRFATFISSRDVFTPQDANNAWEDASANFEIFEKNKALGQTDKFNMFQEKVLPVLINNCPQDNNQLFSNDYIKNILKFIHKYSSDGVNFDMHLFNLCEKALLDILAEKYGVSYRDQQGRWNAAKEYSAKIKTNNATRL